MKNIKYLLLFLLSFGCKIIFAQNTFPATGSAGIGTTSPNASSILEIKSTIKGILIPRMTSTQRDAIASPATGLLIYQTNSTKGFYYYNGSAWTGINSVYTAGTGISISGSAITNTKPDKTVVLTAGTGIAVTGTYPNFTIAATGSGSGQWTTSGSNIYYSSGNVGIGTSSPAYKLDVNGDINIAATKELRIGGIQVLKNDAASFNLWMGSGGISNTTGTQNTSDGVSALNSNTTGTSNTATGYLSLSTNTTGGNNTAMGVNALKASNGNDNSAVGVNALLNNTSGSQNSALGSGALYANTNGNYNTATGYLTLGANTSGSENTAYGYGALNFSTSGNNNTAVGWNALYSNTTAGANVAVGSGALYSNTAIDNTAVGYNALHSNTIGTGNTSMGWASLEINTNGFNNTALGNSAMENNITGAYNTAIGCTALKNNTGSSNTAVGEKAMQNNTSGGSNSVLGSGALQDNTEGSDNTALGFQSLYVNLGASNNTAVGYQSLFNNQGSENTAIGFQSGYNNALGSENIFVGDKSGINNTNGSYNIFMGFQAGNSNTDGSFNTFLGFDAGLNASTANSNTFVGYTAGTVATGGNNTFVGYGSNPQSSQASSTNCVAVGYNAITTAPSQFMLGNPTIAQLVCSVALSVFSDGRYKNNIKKDVVGLDFINKLQPITYTLKVHDIDKQLGIKEDKITFDAADYKEKQVCSGFIAQEVEKAANDVGYNFSGVTKPQDDHGFYGLRYSDFVVPLVKAVQELSKQNDSLKSQVESLQHRVESFTSQTPSLQNPNDGFAKISLDGSNDLILLGQNVPNPFDNSTLIPFRLPANCHDASIMIVQTGTSHVVSVIPISCNQTNISIDGGTLADGSYTYSLYVDGKQIATKQMILNK